MGNCILQSVEAAKSPAESIDFYFNDVCDQYLNRIDRACCWCTSLFPAGCEDKIFTGVGGGYTWFEAKGAVWECGIGQEC